MINVNSDKDTVVYRIYDKNQIILYVGMTNNIKLRLKQHKQDKSWWKDKDIIEVSQLLTRNEAHIYEIYYISNLRPLYNIDFKDGGLVNIKLPNIKFHNYNFRSNKRSKINLEQLKNLFQSGKTTKEIAIMMGHSTSYINSQLVQLKLRPKSEKTKSRYDEIYNYIDAKIKLTIAKQGYINLVSILKRKFGKDVAKRFLQKGNDFERKYKLKNIRLDKYIKAKLKIRSKGYGNILVPQDFEINT